MFTTARISWPLRLLCFLTATSFSAGQYLHGRSQQAQCGANFTWMSNSQHFDSCQLSAFVWGSCFTSNWDVPPLQSDQQQYTNPNITTANLCTCSWSAYNLISACTACQGFPGSVQNWAAYTQSCAGFLTDAYFPSNITLPTGTAIPYWATINPTDWNDGRFDTAEAQSLAADGKPDVIQGQTPPASNSKGRASVGAIVGGVVGGLAVLALVGLIAWRLMRKRRQGLQEIDPTGSHPYMIEARSPHGRSLSNLSGKSTVNPMSISVVNSSHRPGTIYTTATTTHTGSVHSLSYASGQMSPMRVVSPPPTIQISNQEFIEPYDIHSPRPQPPVGMKRKTSAATTTYSGHSHNHSHGQDTLAPIPAADVEERNYHERLNPPAYSQYESSPASSPEPMETTFRTPTPDSLMRRDPVLGHRTYPEQVSVDSQRSWDSGTSHGSGGSISALDDVVERMGLRTVGPASTVGGDTLATGQSAHLGKRALSR